jgi:hypothetical protein
MNLPLDHDGLLDVVHQAPVGLVQVDEHGHVSLVNPSALRLLAPVLSDGDLTDLHAVLRPVCPAFVSALTEHPDEVGPVRPAERFLATTSAEDEHHVELKAVRVEAGRVMVVVLDVSLEVRMAARERARALEVNDTVVQHLVAAETALGLGLLAEAGAFVTRASEAARHLLGRQLVEAVQGDPAPAPSR